VKKKSEFVFSLSLSHWDLHQDLIEKILLGFASGLDGKDFKYQKLGTCKKSVSGSVSVKKKSEFVFSLSLSHSL
jgi:hypothetical protein